MKHNLDTMLAVLRQQGVPTPEREYPFHGTRGWRFDVCWPSAKVAFEVEGVTHQGGRHQRKDGFEEDVAKYNEATLLGWVLIRATPKQVASGLALSWLERALGVTREGEADA